MMIMILPINNIPRITVGGQIRLCDSLWDRIYLIAVQPLNLSTVICIRNTTGAEMKLSDVDMAQDDPESALLFRDSLA